MSHTFVFHDDFGEEEVVIVENDDIQVLSSTDDGQVLADHVRIYDVRNKQELAYWSMTEWKEGNDGEDPATAMNAILASICRVAEGRFRDGMRELLG